LTSLKATLVSTLTLILFLDILLHRIWLHHKQTTKYADYHAFVETVKKTPRPWNSTTSLKAMLKQMSWLLNIDITLLSFKQAGETYHCPHGADYFFLTFLFQNPMLKLLRKQTDWTPVIIIQYNKKYFVPVTKLPAPSLINIAPEPSGILVNNTFIHHHDILKLLNNDKVDFSFSLVVYSAYSYVRKTFSKEIQKTILGMYCSSTSDQIVHLFLVPKLHSTAFDLFLLEGDLPLPPSFHKTSLLDYQHLTEGKPIFKGTGNKVPTVLNQEQCLCDHDETQYVLDSHRYDTLMSTHAQTRLLTENLKALGLLDKLTERKLKVCSEISFLSYDTEALNKAYVESLDDTFYNQYEFNNNFTDKLQHKVIHGEQKLYIIGLCDIISKKDTLRILKKHLPSSLYIKICRYVLSDSDDLRSHISWESCHSQLKHLPLNECAEELLTLFETVDLNETHVKTFHISNNHLVNKATEPTHENTTQMIYKFLVYIYQRNILASIIKYILLKPLLIQFETSMLVNEKRGIFYLIQKRLQDIIFESILTAFNGSNYDNYLLSNSLVIIVGKLKEKIKIFKKGASLSTIQIIIKKNLFRFRNIIKTQVKTTPFQNKVNTLWEMKLFIKDIRNLVAANMSLDRIGKLFNLEVAKLCFPYEQATSVKKIKSITSLHAHNESFWKNTFANKTVDLTTRLEAQQTYDAKQFNDLYEYGEYYLVQDCLLLHSIVLTLFRTYLQESINIFTRHNYSQSNLAYQQFFIVEPSQQIDKNLAPKQIKNTFYNYFIKHAVTGGLCTSFVHGEIGNQTIINEHLNSVNCSNLDKDSWPNFANLQGTPFPFHEKADGISTIDIRSLYPSAAVKKLPVGSPLFYTRLIPQDYHRINDHNMKVLRIQNYCKRVRDNGNHTEDFMYLNNTPPRFYNEFYALNHYLQCIPKDVVILRFQSSFTALGQLYFTEFPLDGFLSYFNPHDQKVYLKLIQYQSVFYHGHKKTCAAQRTPEDLDKAKKSNDVRTKILSLCQHFRHHFNLVDKVDFDYVEISDCDFFLHKIPKNGNFCPSFKKSYCYNDFLDAITQKKLTGFVLVKNLTIKKQAQNPIFGFIIQKVEYGADVLSPYTQNITSNIKAAQRVVSMNEAKSFMVISTEYLNWLHVHFGFEHPPDIYHALLFQLDTYLKPYIENKLILRKELKDRIKLETNLEKKQVFEIQSELIKLMLNSCYGFTLCNITSNKFKMLENRRKLPNDTKSKNRLKSCIQLGDKVFLAELNKQVKEPFQTLLGHVGCYILYHSKIILLKRLYYLLKYLNPTHAQLLYMDTDSAHFLVKHKDFVDNVDDNYKAIFQRLYNKHFDSGNKISGIWVQEGFFDKARYIGEKSYLLFNSDNSTYLAHMKGLNQPFQRQFVEQNIDPKHTSVINYNIFQKTSDFMILKTSMSKNLFDNYVPIKRYFVKATGSLPLTLSEPY